MGKKRDYTRYSKGPVESTESVEVVETATEEIETVEVKQEPVIEEVKIEESERIIGVVSGCSKLNVRECPNSDAEVLGIITANTEVIVTEVFAANDFYKICTPAGLEGYCVKNYITIMP